MDAYDGEFYVTEAGFDSPLPIGIAEHKTKVLDNRARFMLALVERWGMVSGKDGGEDSSGRSKLTLMSTEEVVDRAAESTISAFSKIDSLGWFDRLPSIEDATDILDNAPETNR